MADQQKHPEQARLLWDGVEYDLISDLTEREKFEAERLTKQSIDEFGHYTAALLLAYFTLKRAEVPGLFWDDFLDSSKFSWVTGAEEDSPADPLPAATAAGAEEPTVTGGRQPSARSSASTPGE